MQRWRQMLALGGMSLLAGCLKTPPQVWQDYCFAQKRQIPAEERYRDVLLEILSNRDKYDARFANAGGVHFFSYYDQLRRERGSLSNKAIAERYIKEYPQCCSQQMPTYLREKWQEIDDPHWQVDVRIGRQLPSGKARSSRLTDEFVRAVDSCDENIRYESGINGILE